jgi:uncharacterized membrane protein
MFWKSLLPIIIVLVIHYYFTYFIKFFGFEHFIVLALALIYLVLLKKNQMRNNKEYAIRHLPKWR